MRCCECFHWPRFAPRQVAAPAVRQAFPRMAPCARHAANDSASVHRKEGSARDRSRQSARSSPEPIVGAARKARKRSRLAHRVARVATIGMSCGAAADCRIARRRERLLRLDRARALDVLDVLGQPRSSVKKKEMASRGYRARPAAVTERRGRRGHTTVSHAAHRRSRCFGYSSSTPLSSGIRNSVATMSSTYSAASSAIAT